MTELVNPLQVYELWKANQKGKHVGCSQGCEENWGTYKCWECPDSNAPSHAQIEANEKTLTAVFGVRHKLPKLYYCRKCRKCHRRKSKRGRLHFQAYLEERKKRLGLR